MSAGRRAISVSSAVMRSARRSPFCSGAGGADRRGMAPDPRIGGEVWRIAGQVMYEPLAVEPCDVLRDREGLVGGSPSRISCRGLRRQSLSRSTASIKPRLNRAPNRCAISSRTIWHAHTPQSNPCGRGLFPLIQRTPAVRASGLVCYFVAHRVKQRVHAKRLVQGLSCAQEFGDT